MKHAYSYPDGSFYKYVATELSKEELSATLMRSIDELVAGSKSKGIIS